MILNNNVKNTLKYGANITWGNFFFHRKVDFYTGKETYRMWHDYKLVGEYESFEEMKREHYRMLEVK
ncbi:MAG: hypothetical protein ACRC7S_09245 [Cetobacterium sp.]